LRLMIGLTVLLLLAPTRRLLLRRWYIVLPAAMGAVFGLRFASAAVAQGAPAIVLLLAPLMAAGMFAGAVLDVFGRKPGGKNDEGQR